VQRRASAEEVQQAVAAKHDVEAACGRHASATCRRHWWL
jgi:hypothetical protein